MARLKLIPDANVFAQVRQMLMANGDKAVSFASVSRATGLAAATLVQRFGSRDTMIQLALLAAWNTLEAITTKADADAPLNPKGAHNLLKAVAAAETLLLISDIRDNVLRQHAKAWRDQIEAALTKRMDCEQPAQAAAILFAAWQGQLLWNAAGGKRFKLKDAVRILSA